MIDGHISSCFYTSHHNLIEQLLQIPNALIALIVRHSCNFVVRHNFSILQKASLSGLRKENTAERIQCNAIFRETQLKCFHTSEILLCTTQFSSVRSSRNTGFLIQLWTFSIQLSNFSIQLWNFSIQLWNFSIQLWKFSIQLWKIILRF